MTTIHLARTLTVRPHHDDKSTFEIAWGEGSQRESFVTGSASLAAVVATGPVETRLEDEVQRYATELGLPTADATGLLSHLREYGLYQDDPDALSTGERRWLDVAWTDALDLHLSSHDAMWVHDYTGNPKVMTRFFVDRRLDPTTPPPPRREVPGGERVVLPPTKSLPERLSVVQSARRTTRQFSGTSLDLGDVATILRWTFSPHFTDEEPPLHTTQTYSRGAPFFAYVLFAGDGAPSEVQADHSAYVYDPIGDALVHQADAPVGAWSELLWRQNYADGAPMLLVVCVDWIQYMWKYRMSRAYRWAYMECGGFMQTALTVGTGLGLRTFQTPAVDDHAFTELLSLDDAEATPLYMAAFGRRGPQQ
ncbi:nitroreductase family protein [Promicromonospora vindobonensis]|uniref:Nitroreductase family protein n=1 Tax=Promicromonospora vindobonensis TaxID=195748 RepID=A0ABW5VYZ4_9MICO